MWITFLRSFDFEDFKMGLLMEREVVYFLLQIGHTQKTSVRECESERSGTNRGTDDAGEHKTTAGLKSLERRGSASRAHVNRPASDRRREDTVPAWWQEALEHLLPLFAKCWGGFRA